MSYIEEDVKSNLYHGVYKNNFIRNTYEDCKTKINSIVPDLPNIYDVIHNDYAEFFIVNAFSPDARGDYSRNMFVMVRHFNNSTMTYDINENWQRRVVSDFYFAFRYKKELNLPEQLGMFVEV